MGRTNSSTIVPGTIIGTDLSLTADVLPQSMRHCFKPGTNFGLAIGGAPATREEVVYVASGAGTIQGFHGLLNVVGSANLTMDLKKNGVSILSAPISITNAQANREVVDGTLSSVSFVAGDVFSMAETVTVSTGASGPYAFMTVTENQAPV